MKVFYPRNVLLLFITTLMLSGCTSFGGEIQQGTTQEDVEKILGKPRGFHRRWMPNNETREVWVYHTKGPSIKNHLYPETYFIVFSNGKVVAKDPRDPYAPLK